MIRKTITALATPPGVSGLAVLRISGDDAFAIIDKCFRGKGPISDAASHTIHYGKIMDGTEMLDTVTVSVFIAPNSYTGENVVEIGCHGGTIVSGRILDLLIREGAEYAEAGEFTRRAFLNGKLDLTQVEAVADLIHSVSVPGSQTAARQINGNFTRRFQKLRTELLDVSALLELELDFSDEGIDLVEKSTLMEKINEVIDFCERILSSQQSSEILRSGYHVGIVGYPNSGKSTLFNALLGRPRAIVSQIAGTTRDYLEETLHLGGIAVKIVDTAGLRETTDTIEIQGIELAESVLERSNLILVINDISEGMGNSEALFCSLKEKFPETDVLLLQNKIDLTAESKASFTHISAATGEGIEQLKAAIAKKAKLSTERISDILVNSRHARLLTMTIESLQRAKTALESDMENEIIAIDLREARRYMGEVTGEEWNEEVLDHIFSRFCIGK